MRYLSRRGFVHRDLAARNILVSKGLSCKVGGLATTDYAVLQLCIVALSVFTSATFLLLTLAQIADFGLSRKLAVDQDYYVTTGGKVPVKWTAPEVRKYCYQFP